MEIVQKVLEFLLAVLFMGLGGLLLLAGRKYIWLLLGGGGFLIAAALIAVVLGQDNGWNLAQEQMWIPLLIALLAGVLGIFIAQNYDRLAADIIGFAAGVYIVTWFDQILLYLDNRALDSLPWWMIPVFAVGGIIGVWLTRRDRDQALILISVIIGANTITSALNLDQTRSITAVITLGLTLTGVLVQYGSFLRESPRNGRRLPPVPHPISEELPYE